MSSTGLHLIRRAIADLQRSTSGTVFERAVNTAYAKGMIELAYAESLLNDTQYDDFNRQVNNVNQVDRLPVVDTSAWQACNPACDPEFNGGKSRFCMCAPAKAAMQLAAQQQGVASA
jgi:hypothetical protein